MGSGVARDGCFSPGLVNNFCDIEDLVGKLNEIKEYEIHLCSFDAMILLLFSLNCIFS